MAAIQAAKRYTRREQTPHVMHLIKPRVQEIVAFARKMQYKRLGIALCVGLHNRRDDEMVVVDAGNRLMLTHPWCFEKLKEGDSCAAILTLPAPHRRGAARRGWSMTSSRPVSRPRSVAARILYEFWEFSGAHEPGGRTFPRSPAPYCAPVRESESPRRRKRGCVPLGCWY